MHHHDIFSAQFLTKLSYRFDKMQSFDISDSSSYFYNSDFIISGKSFDSILDLIRDMWNHLDSPSKEITSSFFLDDGQVNLSRSDAAFACHVLIDKSFIVSQIQISLKAISSHKGFTMFKRRHRPSIYLQIRIHLHNIYLISASFEQLSYRSCGYSFS